MKKLRIISLFIISYLFYLLFTQLLFAEDNLVQLKGQLLKKDNFMELDQHDQKRPINYVCLSFMLQKDKRLYILKLDVDGIAEGFRVLKGVDLSLGKAGEIAVWVKKSDRNKIRPKVYKVEADGLSVFELPYRPGNNAFLFLMLALLALAFASTYYLPKVSAARNWRLLQRRPHYI
ncbi:hypothetical protein VRU48_10820 [Pedobacter sp. KR3-3]|uniref:Uncharacterized protein n=1 Tax=Pedobacter albus TaxID=3113905 RepID=A0ABU7I7Z6_9SPHI|nr:hypothetical protein [Pedobacter sp. KR3-3]MEE1945598.1 hypothetical protein [Pedobacter sp. KR3-3]